MPSALPERGMLKFESIVTHLEKLYNEKKKKKKLHYHYKTYISRYIM